ncbi:MAG: hypothetical protein HY695_29425 [Deltaproteobacteria bacterium]|nr:hypothetical protein [Deltaproteobacteria bacterium]
MSCREPEPKIQELKAHTDTAQKLEQTKKTLLRPAIVMDDNGETPEKAIERFQLLRNWPAQEKGFAFVSRGSSFHVRMVFARKVSTHILQSVLIL